MPPISEEHCPCNDLENGISNKYMENTNLSILEDGSFEEVDSHNATEPIKATAMSGSTGTVNGRFMDIDRAFTADGAAKRHCSIKCPKRCKRKPIFLS